MNRDDDPGSSTFSGRRIPTPSRWTFPHASGADGDGVVAVGGDLEPGTLLQAYSGGIFPMPLRRRRLAWFSPDPRAVLPVEAMHVSRTLRRSMRRFSVTVDRNFEEVVRSCGDPRRPHGWINEEIIEAYGRLHDLGWAHSVEVWADGELAGGLYGVSIGALFAGESMFHRVTDASKAAVVATCEILSTTSDALFDVQWQTPHLESLGVVEIDRSEFLDRLHRATRAPEPAAFRTDLHQVEDFS